MLSLKFNAAKLPLFLVTITILSVLLARVLVNFSQTRSDSNSMLEPLPDNIRVESHGYTSSHRPEEAIPFSDVVLIATITGIGEAQWNTVDGLRSKDWSVASIETAAIYTPYNFDVTEVLKGDMNDLANQAFAIVGGQVKQDSIQMVDNFHNDIQAGDEVVLFLRVSNESISRVAHFTYVDALRTDGIHTVAECQDNRSVNDCDVVYKLDDVKSKIQ